MTTEERLESIEKKLSRHRRLLTVVFVGVGAYVAIGVVRPQMLLAQPATEPPKEIRASSFVLLDENNKTRAVLGFERAGGASLRFIDVNGKIRVGISEGEAGAGLAVLDKSGMVRVEIWADDEPRLALSDGTSKPRFEVLERNDRSLMLSIFDESQTSRIVLGVDKDGSVLSLNGKNPRTGVGLGVDKDDVPRMVMIDKDGKLRWSAP